MTMIYSASVTQLDVRPTGDQEVASSSSARSATFLHGNLIMKYFLQLFSPFCCQIQEGQLSVSGKRMCTILVNHLED